VRSFQHAIPTFNFLSSFDKSFSSLLPNFIPVMVSTYKVKVKEINIIPENKLHSRSIMTNLECLEDSKVKVKRKVVPVLN
jgi:hypothetical protein